MVQFLSIIFFSWISSIFVGFFKSSRFFCVILYNCWLLSLFATDYVYCAVATEATIKLSLVLLFKELIIYKIKLDHVFQSCAQWTAGKWNGLRIQSGTAM